MKIGQTSAEDQRDDNGRLDGHDKHDDHTHAGAKQTDPHVAENSLGTGTDKQEFTNIRSVVSNLQMALTNDLCKTARKVEEQLKSY